MSIPAITVDLSEDQIDELEPILSQLRHASAAGAPGAAMAQIIFGWDHMKVFFVTNEQMRELQRIMTSPVGMTTNDL